MASSICPWSVVKQKVMDLIGCARSATEEHERAELHGALHALLVATREGGNLTHSKATHEARLVSGRARLHDLCKGIHDARSQRANLSDSPADKVLTTRARCLTNAPKVNDANSAESELHQLHSAAALKEAVTKMLGAPPESRIEPVFHQSWKTCTLPKKQGAWRRHCEHVLSPQWRMQLFTDVGNRDVVATHFPSFLPLYDAYNMTIQRVDAARLFYLYLYGGVYADLDMLCLRPLEELTMPAGHVTLAYKVGDSVLRGANCTDARCYLHKAAGMRSGLWQGVPNAFIAAPRRHPFIGFLIHRLGAAANGVYRGNPSPIVSTGPAFLGQAMHEWVRHPAVRAASSSLLHIHPLGRVYTHRTGGAFPHPCGSALSDVPRGGPKEQRKAFENCARQLSRSVLTTFWAHSWVHTWQLELLAQKVTASGAMA